MGGDEGGGGWRQERAQSRGLENGDKADSDYQYKNGRKQDTEVSILRSGQ